MSSEASFAAETPVGAAGVVYTGADVADHADVPSEFAALTAYSVFRFVAAPTDVDVAGAIVTIVAQSPPLTR
ncbi:MAG: hypothetical protein ACJLS2_02540 [Microcella pacifica]